MAVSQAYVDQIGELLGFVPHLRLKRMFGGLGIFCAEVMFGLVVQDELFLKADAESRPLFEAQGCVPWTYSRPGKSPMDMGYMSAPEGVWDEPDEARRWADLAIGAAMRKRTAPIRKR